MSAKSRTRVIVCRSACSSRLFAGRATSSDSKSDAAEITPNQTTKERPTNDGRPTSRMTCASPSRSYASLHAPQNAEIARIRSSTGVRRTSRAPVRPVPTIARSVLSASSRGAGLKPCSCITNASTTPVAAIPTPPTITGRRSEMSASATLPPIAANATTRPICAERRYTGRTLSTPISSASHASVAPLVNV